MPTFHNGAPQRTFKKKDGTRFTKTYHSAKAAQRAERAWVANGGSKPSRGKLKK